ncbi:MAG: 50S ribosomal protein L17 [Pirellulaceae bacterium]|nr:50S ribosomal protein L17 [Planctomycetales bacterium]MCC7338362.1 50S ribosomal protein L17 [Pirellulaceae bacterium]
MRHRRHGRTLGRSPSHRRALLRNLASALFITERPDSQLDVNPPKVKGRIVTTMAKAKEVRPMVEKCITIAKKGVAAEKLAAEFGTQAERNTAAWKQWREGPNHAKWMEAMAPAVFARRRLIQILCDKQAVQILFDELAERFEDRPGGYTRIMRLATPRLGDNGPRAILEFVGRNDRVVVRSQKPDFGGEEAASGSDSPNADSSNNDATGQPPTAENSGN